MMRNQRLTRLEKHAKRIRPALPANVQRITVDLRDAAAGAAQLPSWVASWLTPTFAQETVRILEASGAMDERKEVRHGD